MKTNELYILRDIAGDSLLVPVGEATQRLNGMNFGPVTCRHHHHVIQFRVLALFGKNVS